MVDTHFQSFFGQNTGIIVMSPSKEEPFILIRFIKKKDINTWERPSAGEGKIIKISMEEIVMILEVLNKNLFNWTTYHSFKNNRTKISFSWENNGEERFWITIDNYSKMLTIPQAEILKMLLKHILKEKIKHATILRQKTDNQIKNNKQSFEEFYDNYQNVKNDSTYKSNVEKSKNIIRVEGLIKGETSKALLINFNSIGEIWIPKSTIRSDYISNKNIIQEFLIDSWILKKNKIIS
ncbi:MAG: hypothetical protein ACTSVV_09195 [Promethearchaeota archaeon]